MSQDKARCDAAVHIDARQTEGRLTISISHLPTDDDFIPIGVVTMEQVLEAWLWDINPMLKGKPLARMLVEIKQSLRVSHEYCIEVPPGSPHFPKGVM